MTDIRKKKCSEEEVNNSLTLNSFDKNRRDREVYGGRLG